MEQDGLKAGKTLDQVTNSPEYKAVVDQMQQLDAQEQDLRKQAATVKADAQVAAAKAAQDALNQQTTISVTSGSLGNIQSRLSGYQSSLDTQIAAINSNPSLSADQKAAQIAQAQAQTAANQFLAQAQIKTIQSYDDPAAIAQIKADIAHKYAEITDPKSTVLTDAQKEDLRKQFLTTQQSLNMITQAQNQRDAAAKDQVIKCAVFALVNTGAALNCMK